MKEDGTFLVTTNSVQSMRIGIGMSSEGFYNAYQCIVQASTYRELGSRLYWDTSRQMRVRPHGCEIEPSLSWRMWPACVNLAFSCEISLKLLVWLETHTMAKGHRLWTDLYSKLSEDRKATISDKVVKRMRLSGSAMVDYSPGQFDEDLKASDRTFVNERYVFEMIPGATHSVRPLFLDVLSDVLIQELQSIG